MLLSILLYALVFILAAFLLFWLISERGRPMMPSTWAGLKAQGLRGILNFKAIHMYIYGRWTSQYLGFLHYKIFPRLSPRGLKWWSDRYHAKVLTDKQARAIITLERDLELRDLEQVIPYPVARDLVLSGPPDVVAYECACRSSKENPCTPTQVCLVIGKPFTDFVLEHTPKKARRLTQAEALELLEAEHKRGHMHSAWFKDAMLGRFYSICNCCKCCCGGVMRMTKYNSGAMSPSGFSSKINKNKCTSCGACVKSCPFNAITMEKKAVVNHDKCMGCGVCTSQCAAGCISLVRDESKGLPMDVRLLT